MSPETEADLRSLSVHECGHLLVGRHFGMGGIPQIVVADDGTITGGWCFCEFKGKEFVESCVGWGGVLAEHLLGCVARGRTPIPWPLAHETFEDWHDAVLYHVKELSDADRRSIISYFDPARSCRFAFQIFTHNKDRLKMLAAKLADFYRPQIESKIEEAARWRVALEEWKRNPPRMSTSYRAKLLLDYLAGLPPEHPDHARLGPMLDCLRRGEEPPAAAFGLL